MDHSDEWLATRWAAGDKVAMAALVSRYYQPLLHLFHRLAGHRTDAEDLVQETWLRALRSLQEPRAIAVRPWLYRIAGNLWRDRARTYARQQARGIALEPWTPDLPLTAPDDVAAAVVRLDEAERVRAAILALSPPHQEVLLLRHYQGLSYDEIAAATDVPVGTVRSRLHHAINHLRRQLQEPEGGASRERPIPGI